MQWTTKFLLSAMDAKQFPAASVPEVAFLGRSNVGKSSLINALLGSVQAKVSQTPGRTRAINFFALQPAPNKPPAMLFADLPGYGYAKISKSISSEWPTFIEPYLEDRETLALCVCLVDSNIPVQESDIQLQAALRRWGRSVVVVATKADRHSNNTLKNAMRELQKGLGVDRIVACSANKKTGMKDLWAEILAAAGISG
jgi:GTP-binding protein